MAPPYQLLPSLLPLRIYQTASSSLSSSSPVARAIAIALSPARWRTNRIRTAWPPNKPQPRTTSQISRYVSGLPLFPLALDFAREGRIDGCPTRRQSGRLGVCRADDDGCRTTWWATRRPAKPSLRNTPKRIRFMSRRQLSVTRRHQTCAAAWDSRILTNDADRYSSVAVSSPTILALSPRSRRRELRLER